MERSEVFAVIDAFYKAWAGGDLVGVLRCVDDDVDYATRAPAAFPYGGRCRGRTQLAQLFGFVSETIAFESFTPRETFQRGDVVVVVGDATGRVRRNGAPFSTAWAHVFRFSCGKITRIREYLDRNVLGAALGEVFAERPVLRAV